MAVFADIAATEQIKTANEDGSTLAVYDGYTVLDNPKSIDDNYLITPEQYGEDGAVNRRGHIWPCGAPDAPHSRVWPHRWKRIRLTLITWLSWPVLIYRGGETMDVKGLAIKYYPRLWDIDRLKAWWPQVNCLRRTTRT